MSNTRKNHIRRANNETERLLQKTNASSNEDPRFDVFARRIRSYIRHLDTLNYSSATFQKRYYHLRAFARWLLLQYDLEKPEDITPKQLRAWQKNLVSRKSREGELLNARTINKYIIAVRHFLRSLSLGKRRHEQLYCALELLKEPKVLPTGILTHRQVRRILNHIETLTPQGISMRTMLEVLYSTGIRIGELLGLNLEDIDMRSGTLFIFGKGRKERIVPLGSAAGKHLMRYIKHIRPGLLKQKDEQAVFLDNLGKRMPYHTIRRLIVMCGEQSGVKVRVTAHVFRRTCTTELLRAGAGVYHLKEFLGHESLQTLEHYARLTIRDLKKTHRKFHPREKDTDAFIFEDPAGETPRAERPSEQDKGAKLLSF